MAERNRVRGSALPQGRQVGNKSAEAKRRERAGIRSPHARGVAYLVWEQPRNGLPEFRPYRYCGLGYDQITGEEDEQCA